MQKHIGQIWLGLLLFTLAVVIVVLGDSLKLLATNAAPFQKALSQLGILYIIALFVERSLEVFIKAWRQGRRIQLEDAVRSANNSTKPEAEKRLEEYRVGTQKRALLVGLTMGILVSISGVRLLGSVFALGTLDVGSFQLGVFHLIDIVVTAGLIGGGSAQIHQVMALIEDLLKETRKRAGSSNGK